MQGSRSVRTLPYWFLGFGWVLLGLLLIVFVILLGIRHAKLDFIRRAEALHDRLVQRVLSNEVVLEGFSAYFSVGKEISFHEVRAYARKMREHYPHIYQLEAQTKVASSDLAAFERRMRAAGYPNYKVRQFNYETDRRWQEVTPQPVHYPIYFMEPVIPEAEPVLGLDVFSLPHLRKAIVKVACTGRTVVSSPVQLIEGGRAYILFAPVDRAPVAATRLAMGKPYYPEVIVSVVLRTQELISERELLSADDIILYHSAFAAQDPEGWIYRHPVPSPSLLERALLPRLSYSQSLAVPGHPFVLHVGKQLTWSVLSKPLMMAVCGFLVFTSVVLAFHIRARRTSEGQRDEATRALAAERDLLNGITETAVSAIVVFDREGSVTFANQRAENILGLTRQENGWRSESGGQCTFIPRGGPPVAQSNPMLRPILDSGKPIFAAQHVLQCPDGSCKLLSINAAPLKDGAGVINNVVCAVEDITERKRAEQQLKHNEIQLRKQARQLAEADRRKDDFLAMLGHELRNPLSPIRNAVAWCQRHPDYLHPRAYWAKEVIARQVEHLAHLVDDLLDVSRITQGRIELRRAPTNLAEVVSRALEIVTPTVDGRKQNLRVCLPERPVWLHADAIRLAQVLGNLLDNASRCTEVGGKLWLTVTRDAEQVAIRVRDNGIGIPEDMLAHIFQPFQRVNCPADTGGGGFGLGLALVRSLVKLHGGNVSAYSSGPRQGSEFTVRLPVLAEPIPQISSAAVSRGRPAKRASKRILVVDDESDAAFSLAMLLETMGHETCTASDGPEALEAVASFQPQVVMLDLGLPGMDGYEIARRLRRAHTHQSLLLVALSGHGQMEHRRRSQAVGIDQYLTKPVDDHALESLIDDFTPL